MTQTTHLSCTCGQTRLTVEATPIVAAECCCTSCRTAGGRLEALPGAPKIVEPNGATQLVLYRKDRVHFDKGAELLREHRLAPQSATRRVVAICCNTPIFLEFTKGHWLSLYGCLWSPEARPRIEMRTMTSDALPGANLSNDIPNPKRQTFSFFVKLLSAWLAMGFSVPKITFVKGKSMTKRDDKIEITQRLPTLRPSSGMERKGRVWLSRRLAHILKASTCV